MRRLLVLALLLAAAGFGAGAAYACSCAGESPVAAVLAEAEVAFVGEVTRSIGGRVQEIRVHGVLKGEVGRVARIHVRGGGAGSCGRRALSPGPVLYMGSCDLRIAACDPIWTGDAVAPALARARVTPSPPSPDVATIGPKPRSPLRRAVPWLPLLGVVVAGAVVVSRRRPAFQ